MQNHSYLLLIFIIPMTLQVGFYAKNWPQAQEIVDKMTLDQKIGQVIQLPGFHLQTDSGLNISAINDYYLGSILVSGNACPNKDGDLICKDFYGSTAQNWKKFADKLMAASVKVDNVVIKPMLGIDAVHGNQHVVGEPLFPQNIGIAASHNVANHERNGYWTGKSVRDCGFHQFFAPNVAVTNNPQWGRHYETGGTNATQIREFAKAYVKAGQGINYSTDKISIAITCAKHYIGDGATQDGCDCGSVSAFNITSFYEHNIQGYLGALESDVGSIMVSFSGINGVHMNLNQHSLVGVLKEDLKFDGILISDWGQLGTDGRGLPTSPFKLNLFDSTCMMLNSGIDMFMEPGWSNGLGEFFNNVKECINQGFVALERLDDAVKRILAVKIPLNLVTTQSTKEKEDVVVPESVGDQKSDILTAAQESLILVKNDNEVLPLSSAPKYVLLTGERKILVRDVNKTELFLDYDNIGAQNGGWTVRWQGFLGNQYWKDDLKVSSGASSILDGLKAAYPNARFLYPNYTDLQDMDKVASAREEFQSELEQLKAQMTHANTVIVSVTAEITYAEALGDVNCKYCQDPYYTSGCLFSNQINPYLGDHQASSLNISLDEFSLSNIKKVQLVDSKIPQITILLSGRPMGILELLDQSDAFIIGNLPATAGGQAIANSISGSYLFRNGDDKNKVNTLAEEWFTDQSVLNNFPVYDIDGTIPKITNPLFESGFGLSTKAKSKTAKDSENIQYTE